MIRLSTALALAALAAILRADIADDVRSRLSPSPVLRGRFEQVKAIRGLRKPLKSSGTFLLAKGRGVLWNTLKPWASELRVGPDGLSSRRDGKVVYAVKAGEQPGLKLVADVLAALFAGDLAALRGSFEMSGRAQGRAWQVELTPRPGLAAKAAKRITLKGAAHVDALELEEPGGDRAAIRFLGVQGAQTLSAKEEAAFAP